MSNTPELSRFEIRRPLGKGGSGEVYLALDRRLSKEIALKLIPLRKDVNSMLDEERRGAILQQKLARRSPQVPQVFDFGEEGEFFWIAMEYVEGTDLSSALKTEAPFSEDRAVRIADQLCQFLAKLQGFTDKIGDKKILGIIHGDLKPENIRLQANDRTRIIDFGIAKQLSLSKEFTQSLFGTYYYIPPEQIISGKTTPHSDLWAVGVILYQMVSGHLPIHEGSSDEVKRQILEGRIIPLPRSCSRNLHYIVYRTLQRTPEDRYSSAKELRDDLLSLTNRQSAKKSAIKKRLSHETTPEIGGQGSTLTFPWPKESVHSEHSPKDAPRGDKGGLDNAAYLLQEASGRVSRPRRVKLTFTIAMLAAALTILLCQSYAWREAEAIRESLITDPSSDIDQSWHRYKKIQAIDPFKIAKNVIRSEMKRALARAADHILIRYSEGDTSVTEDMWQKALSYFAAALELDEDDQIIRARFDFCRGQLALKKVILLKKRKDQTGARERQQEEAITNFLQASRLDTNWPDPHVSLAAVYAYRQFDLAKLASEVEQAQRRGFHDTRRLNAYLADGHLRQAKDLWKQSKKFEATEHDRMTELLNQAVEHLKTAIELYKGMPGYAQSESNLNEAERWLARIQRRVESLYPNQPEQPDAAGQETSY